MLNRSWDLSSVSVFLFCKLNWLCFFLGTVVVPRLCLLLSLYLAWIVRKQASHHQFSLTLIDFQLRIHFCAYSLYYLHYDKFLSTNWIRFSFMWSISWNIWSISCSMISTIWEENGLLRSQKWIYSARQISTNDWCSSWWRCCILDWHQFWSYDSSLRFQSHTSYGQSSQDVVYEEISRSNDGESLDAWGFSNKWSSKPGPATSGSSLYPCSSAFVPSLTPNLSGASWTRCQIRSKFFISILVVMMSRSSCPNSGSSDKWSFKSGPARSRASLYSCSSVFVPSLIPNLDRASWTKRCWIWSKVFISILVSAFISTLTPSLGRASWERRCWIKREGY